MLAVLCLVLSVAVIFCLAVCRAAFLRCRRSCCIGVIRGGGDGGGLVLAVMVLKKRRWAACIGSWMVCAVFVSFGGIGVVVWISRRISPAPRLDGGLSFQGAGIVRVLIMGSTGSMGFRSLWSYDAKWGCLLSWLVGSDGLVLWFLRFL